MTYTDSEAPPHSFTPGSIRAAWSYRAFRTVWTGQALSQTGTWMQNVALPAYVQWRWHSGTLVGAMVFAQLGPLLLLSIPGSILANKAPRKPWLLIMPTVQMFTAIGLAWFVHANAGFGVLFAATAAMGTANALNAPAFQSSIPMLVHRRDLAGAISLNTAQLNGTRVLGPLIVGLMTLLHVTVSQMLLINGVTFLFVVAAIARIDIPVARAQMDAGWRQLTQGIRIARSRPTLSRLLLSMTIFSLLSLPFVGLFPTIAEKAMNMQSRSPAYSWLYAAFGFGALLGGLSVGSVFARIDKRRIIPPAFIGFAVFLFLFGQLRSAPLSYPVGFALGMFYFMLATAMNTEFQQHMEHSERVLLMALWFMAFGGMVPIGNIVFGPIMDHIGPRWVLAAGALASLALAWWCDLLRMERRGAQRATS
ncbi:MAG: MFS transporter [Actinobacteria bacterium]|uniref:Unannotated protein n=1 Tax=freshwater metagenome TaxID=449393 RepID=A0A6J6UWK9_9ZZZZ|nr:MFS transporter [Actinomycetota bacterium]MSY11647.1 MFS transporter [Actinomycetota bacterium]MSZ04559.1 MFS transporter [Actinomycetota bacterium]MTB08045.1 MFS transporter [Actinomycetota bacterium]